MKGKKRVDRKVERKKNSCLVGEIRGEKRMEREKNEMRSIYFQIVKIGVKMKEKNFVILEMSRLELGGSDRMIILKV